MLDKIITMVGSCGSV